MKRINLPCLISLMLFLLMGASCQNEYHIKGKSTITSLDGKMLYMKMLGQDGGWAVLDSAEIIHGLFTMDGPVDSTMMVMLYMDDEGVLPLILEPGDMKVTLSSSQFDVRGTPLNDALYDFIAKRNEMGVKINDLERREARMVLDGANLDDIHEQLVEEGEKLMEEMNTYVETFIANNFENPVGPTVFMMVYGALPYPVMTDQLEDLMQTAPVAFKQHPFVKDYIDKAKENMKLIEEHNRLQQNLNATAQR